MTNHIVEDNELSNDEILEQAYNNAYKLFTGARKFTDITYPSDVHESYLPFDPYTIMVKEKFEDVKLSMLDWFANEDDFEKCIFVRDYQYVSYVLTMEPFEMSNDDKTYGMD
tara:strand:- start:171 stop:506 length:336 start_codon:yes stop_codon:yes gene_type:complete